MLRSFLRGANLKLVHAENFKPIIIWLNDKKLSSFLLSAACKERMDLVLPLSPLYNQGTWDTDAIPVNTPKHKKAIHTCGKHTAEFTQSTA